MMKEEGAWREMIAAEMSAQGESFADVVSSTISDEGLDVEFYTGYGAVCGEPFTVWTRHRVYFPVCYDGAESCASVARNPDGKPTEHIG